jgi:hypothetical protein
MTSDNLTDNALFQFICKSGRQIHHGETNDRHYRRPLIGARGRYIVGATGRKGVSTDHFTNFASMSLT